jgi:hypothetical protein
VYPDGRDLPIIPPLCREAIGKGLQRVRRRARLGDGDDECVTTIERDRCADDIGRIDRSYGNAETDREQGRQEFRRVQ